MLQVYSPCGDDFKNNCHYMAIFVCFVGIHFYEKEQKEILTPYCIYDIYTICILDRMVSHPISREETDGYYN